MKIRILIAIFFSTILYCNHSFGQVRPMVALTSEFTSGLPLFGVGAGAAFGEEGRFGIGANYEFASNTAEEDGIDHNYVGAVTYFNVYRQGRKSMSLFMRGGNIAGEKWIIIPGAAANYDINEHLTAVLHFGFRPDDPTVGFAVFIRPFKRQ